uniref:Uncharacterized protein n=1 Tax=Glossina austeni TaxID=7395 RepID=A0A1A9VBA6_GLOAU
MKSEKAKFTTNILEGVRNDFDEVNMYITIKFPVNDIIPKTVIMKPIIPNHRGSIGGHLYQYGSTICIISDGTLSAKLTFRPPQRYLKKTTNDLDEELTKRNLQADAMLSTPILIFSISLSALEFQLPTKDGQPHEYDFAFSSENFAEVDQWLMVQ